MCIFPPLCSVRIKSIHVLHMLFALRVIVYNLAQTLIHHVDPMGLKVSLRDYHLFSTWHIPDITEIYIHKKVQFGYHISLEKVMVSLMLATGLLSLDEPKTSPKTEKF